MLGLRLGYLETGQVGARQKGGGVAEDKTSQAPRKRRPKEQGGWDYLSSEIKASPGESRHKVGGEGGVIDSGADTCTGGSQR